MAENTRGPGEFCWVELMTTDTDAAKKFYATIMGWEYSDSPVPGRRRVLRLGVQGTPGDGPLHRRDRRVVLE